MGMCLSHLTGLSIKSLGHNDLVPFLFTEPVSESRYFHDDNIKEHARYVGGSIMVWCESVGMEKSDLHILERGHFTGVSILCSTHYTLDKIANAPFKVK
jgi:hypothetical protein